MPPSLFFSYSHADENLRDQLEVHLSALKRQGLISAWHDRGITVGSDIGATIDAHINTADIVLLLVSPDFINSDYCYEREMARALERHHSGEALVIPVILRPCDWKDLPFGQLLAAPRDGKPITTWPNIDDAFLDVVKSIKAALKELGAAVESPRVTNAEAEPEPWVESTLALFNARSSNLRVKKAFTDLDRDQFRQDGFEFIAKYFKSSLDELIKRNLGVNLQYRFQRITPVRFSAAVYRDGEKVSKCSVSMSSGLMGRDGIEYSMDDELRHAGANEAVSVKADDQTLYFSPLGMQSYGHSRDEKLSQEGAAELFWGIFIGPLQ